MKRRKNKKKKARSNLIPWLLVLTCFPAFFDAMLSKEGRASFTFVRPALAWDVPPEPVVAEPSRKEPRPRKAVPSGLPSQDQKDATSRVCRRIAENRHNLYEPSGISKEAFASTCYYDLLAMAWTESRFDCAAVGDGGLSRGCFQIQTAMHGVKVSEAESYEWAAEWSLDRMVRDTGYPHFRTASIRRHNGAGHMAERYAEAVKAKSAALAASGL
jgi:hypothetical protein